MALGAERGDVLALVVRQGAGLVAAGIVLGVLASAASARLLESFLFGVAADDRLTFVGGAPRAGRRPPSWPAGCRAAAPPASSRWTALRVE